MRGLKTTISFFSRSIVLFLPATVLAQNVGTGPIKEAAEGFGDLNKNQIVGFIFSFAQWALGLVGVVAVIMILWGAFQYITSAGSEEKITSAQKTLLYGVIGTIVAILSFAVVSFSKSFLVGPSA